MSLYHNGAVANFARFVVRSVTNNKIGGSLERFSGAKFPQKVRALLGAAAHALLRPSPHRPAGPPARRSTRPTRPAPPSAPTPAAQVVPLELRVTTVASENEFHSTSTTTSVATYTMAAASTPEIGAFSPTSAMPFSTTTISLQWSLSSDIGKAYTPGSARVQIQTDSKSPAFDCKISKISFSLKSVNRYDESLSCVLPTSLPASSYNLWVCVPGVGCGLAGQQLTVLMGANNVQPTVAGTGGNVLVAISGNGAPRSAPCGLPSSPSSGLHFTPPPAAGPRSYTPPLFLPRAGFSSNASDVTVKFGSSKAQVLESSATSIKVMVGAAPGLVAGSYELRISPSQVSCVQASGACHNCRACAAADRGLLHHLLLP